MPRPRSVEGYEAVHITIPKPEYRRLLSHLYSEVMGRVPPGALKAFFTEAIRNYFDHKVLDLAPYVGDGLLPGTLTVSGNEVAIERLRAVLESLDQ